MYKYYLITYEEGIEVSWMNVEKVVELVSDQKEVVMVDIKTDVRIDIEVEI